MLAEAVDEAGINCIPAVSVAKVLGLRVGAFRSSLTNNPLASVGHMPMTWKLDGSPLETKVTVDRGAIATRTRLGLARR